MSLPFQIPRYCLFWLLIAQALVILPHLERIPVWLIAAWLFSVVWRILVYQGRWSFPGGFVKLMLVITSGVCIMLSYGSFFGLEPTVAWLITAYIFKLLEMRSRRDIIVVIYLSYFVIVTQLLFTQSMPHVFYLLGGAVLITTSLIVLHQSADRPQLWAPLALAIKMILQAVPLMIIMFLVFPRFEPFWSVPLPSHQSKTGFGNRMSPGDIARLARSGELAFRAEFEGTMPTQQELYWRGLVLSEFNGRSWLPSDDKKLDSVSMDYKLVSASKVFQYSVILEPTQRHWLFSLPVAESSNNGVLYDRDFLLSSEFSLSRRFKYDVVSYVNVIREPHLERSRRRRELKLPDDFNPRARQIAHEWMNELEDQERYVARVLRYFNEKPFVYTLQPPRLGEHSVDEFLFRTRKGFCEHYASSFAFMMRAAGIPARVVVGYQGGTRSPYSNYIIVRQLDAHAWVEVWMAGQGWIRLDPTSMVSPDRIEYGSEETLAEEETFLSESPLSLIHLRNISWVRDLQFRYDQINHRWHTWVLGYDSQLQFETLKALLGEVTPQRMVLAILLSGGLVLAMIAIGLLLHRTAPKPDPVVKLYKKFCRRIERTGLKRQQGEGAQDFADRLIDYRPDLRTEVGAITKLFMQLEYSGEGASAGQIKQLRLMIRELSMMPRLYQRSPEI